MNSSANNHTKIKSNQNIQVYVRVRPLNSRERAIRSCEVVEVQSPKEIIVKQMFDSKTTKKFTFDRSFGQESRQAEVYQAVVAPLIEEVLSGYNCTVFAYGQTGTGKTHTMVGIENPDLKSSWEDESMVGIIPRALSHLFDELRMMEVEFSMRISYLELYNEELCDLLSSEDSTKIRIFDDSTKKGSLIIQGLEEIPVHSKDDVYKLLEKGKERRKTATTLMNAMSSRSHTVFSILVHIRENNMEGEEMLKIGKLNLVDLAGSENISKAGNEKGIRTRETVNINQSLLTLGRVITALVERTPHVPYRESKLTRLLQESLGGRTKTSIIATISPGHKDLEETLSTLEYAHRAKNIQNKPEINQKLTKKTVLKEYTEEIDRLKRDLMAARDKNGIYLAEDTFNDMHYKLDSQNKELNEKVLLVKALKEELASKEKIFNEVSLHLIEKSEELKKTENVLSHTRAKLDDTKKVLAKTGRRVEEKIHLVESHSKTEKVLTEQAIKLIEVADIAASDTHQLHNTIERRQNVEVKNKSACESFVSQMQNLHDSMKEQLTTLNKEHKSYSQIIEEEIGKYSSEYKKFSSTATSKLQLISKQCNESLSGVQKCREKYRKQFTDANTNHRQAFHDAFNELGAREKNLKSIIEDHLTEILEVVNQQYSIVMNSYGQVIERVTNHNQHIGQYVTEAAVKLEEFTTNTTSSLGKEISAINKAIESRKSLASKRQAALENFIKQIESCNEEERQEVEQFEKVPNRVGVLNAEIRNNFDSEIRVVKKLAEDSAKSWEEICDIDSQAKLEMENVGRKYTNSNVVLKQTVEENLNNIEASLKHMENRTNEHGTESLEILESMRKECADIETSLKQRTSSECDNAVDLVGKESQRVMHCQAQYRALTKSLQTSVNEFSSHSNATMTECASNLVKFKENEFRTYIPTGQTPSKKEFTYPRVLAATSPHNNIIRRFRLEKGWLDADTTVSTITEDSEIRFDDSCDELGINSTPIRFDIESANTMLKDIKSEFNCHSQHSSIIGDKVQRPSIPTVSQYDQENKENCID